MLTISPPMSGAGQGDYYLELAQEDYYTKGGEPPGHWSGEGAERLGLRGQVEREELRNLLQGLSPDGSRGLVQNAGKEDRQAGWDLTFSAPKSVSVLWATGSPEMRREIQAAQRAAVRAGLSYLQDEAAITRRGKGGQDKERGSLVFATFEHGTSRAQDPQVHTHAILINAAVRADGTTGTVESKPIFKHKMAAGAVYRAELSKELEARLGVAIRREKSWFEVDGVPKEVMAEFSKRRKEVEAALQESGFSGAKAAKVATLNTRAVKEHVAREKLFEEWGKVAQEMGWTREAAESITQKADIRRAKETETVLTRSLITVTERESHFSKRDLVRAAAEEAQGRGLGAKEVIRGVEETLKDRARIVELGQFDGETRYTTKEVIDLEKKMLESVSSRREWEAWRVADEALEAAFKVRTLDDEQKTAARHVTQAKGAVTIAAGLAGTGKSYMLSAAKDAWEKEGYTVIGAAPTGKAARELETSAGIKSNTIHKTLLDLERGALEANTKSIFVIDEAAMVGTKLMSRLVHETEKTGSKLVLVGDERQLQSVEAGGAFKAFSEKLGRAELKNIRRQREEWAREAVYRFATGEADKALLAYHKKGLVSVAETRKDAATELLSEWRKEGVTAPEKSLILVGTNYDAKALNEDAQALRFSAKELTGKGIAVNGFHVYEGDRVLFTKNDKETGLRNGDLATVEKTSEKSLLVRLDNGRKATVNTERYSEIKLGYAITTHKSQAATIENAFVLLGGSMQDKELSYVQASRAKGKTRFYIDKLEAGEALSQISRAMKKSHEKTLAESLLGKNQAQKQTQRQTR